MRNIWSMYIGDTCAVVSGEPGWARVPWENLHTKVVALADNALENARVRRDVRDIVRRTCQLEDTKALTEATAEGFRVEGLGVFWRLRRDLTST